MKRMEAGTRRAESVFAVSARAGHRYHFPRTLLPRGLWRIDRGTTREKWWNAGPARRSGDARKDAREDCPAGGNRRATSISQRRRRVHDGNLSSDVVASGTIFSRLQRKTIDNENSICFVCFLFCFFFFLFNSKRRCRAFRPKLTRRADAVVAGLHARRRDVDTCMYTQRHRHTDKRDRTQKIIREN